MNLPTPLLTFFLPCLASLSLAAAPAPTVYTPPAGDPRGASYSAPPQDQGLPYTNSGKARGLAAITPYLALFANADYGSRYAYAQGYKIRLDDAHVLAGEPVVQAGVVYVPAAFAGVLALKQIAPAPAPAELKSKWVYTLEPPPVKIPATVRKVEVDGQPYVALPDLAQSEGLTLYQDPRGLILLSRQPIQFQADRALLDNIVTLFDTPDKLADPDIATASIPTLKAQGKWTDHVKATPEQIKLLAGPATQWPVVPESTYDYSGLNRKLLGSPPPPPGVYPRLLFSPEDVPALSARMQSQKLGQKTLIEWEILFKKSWWDPQSSDGQVFAKLIDDNAYRTLAWPKVDISPGAGVSHSLFDGQKPGIYVSHVNYNTNCLTTMALYCLLTGDDAHGRQAAQAICNYYKLIEPAIDDVNQKSDSQFGTSPDGANFAETGWRGMHGVVAHMDLPFALDFAGKWMNPEQKETMRRIIAKATYGRRDNMQASPTRVRDINHLTWHLTGFLAASAIEGLAGCDPEVLAAGRESARAWLDWGIDENGQIFESNGKSGGGLQFEMLSMNVLARRGLDLWGHPHLRKLLAAQVQATAPNGLATVSSGTWGAIPLSPPDVSELKAFYPENLCADYLLTLSYPELKLENFDPAAYRAKLEKSTARLRLPGPTYPAFVFSGLYDTDWRQVSRADLKLPTTFNDPVYGILSASTDATPEAAWLYLHVRANQYIGSGHHHADVGMFYFSALGTNWFTESPFPKSYDGKYHNEVLIDGKAEPDALPGRGDYLGAAITPAAAFGTVNQTQSYTYKWTNQVMLWDNVPGDDMWGRTARTKDWEVSTDPLALAVYKGTQHYKSRPWWPTYNFSNWIPVTQAKWNPVEYAYRTAGLVRGAHPYGLIVDDLKKDGERHLYQWTAMLGEGVGGATVPGLAPNAAVLARQTDVENGTPKPGAPLLWVYDIDGSGQAAAKVETAHDGEVDPKKGPQPYDRVAIDLQADQANYKVLLIPFHQGEKLPAIGFDAAKQIATVTWADQADVLTFSAGADHRTHVGVARQNVTLGQSL